MNRIFKFDLLASILCVVLPGLLIWVRPDWVGIAPENRGSAIAALCAMFVVMLIVFSFGDSSQPARAWRAVRQWAKEHGQLGQVTSPANSGHASGHRAAVLKQLLADHHGPRWRRRSRWILIAGDEPLVNRLVPGLVGSGYVITHDAVLLYARQTGDALDTAWLDQIRRLRRDRPIDAIVAVTRNRTSINAPFDPEGLARQLARHARALRWAAPAYLLNVTDFGAESGGPDEAIGFTWSNARVNAGDIQTSLQHLTRNLADTGVVRIGLNRADRYPAQLSQHIERLGSALSELVLQTARSRYWRHPVHGLLFAPLFKVRDQASSATKEQTNNETEAASLAPHNHAIWQAVADHSRQIHGRRFGFSLSASAAWIATGAVGLWIAGMMVSGLTNRATIGTAGATLANLAGARETQALQALDSLDKQMDTLEIRGRDGAPWQTRFGLNRDSALRAALWPGYAVAASRILVGPIRHKLEDRLRQLASMSDEEIASGGSAQAQAAYDTLKAYLMLAKPEQTEAAFLTTQLVATGFPLRPARSPLSPGAWEDLRVHAIAFFANHAGPGAPRTPKGAAALAIVPDAGLVAATRQTIVGVRGIQNSTEAVYQQILDDAKPKYPPVSLATLLGDTTSRGL
ncbi:ImcF-related family protein, partial [Paraburkholderia sp.]|uniref:ImcF-related family protein n=1 Tax=Paraburkholderia sp. TaxID=1926495 RepID=UPI0025E33FF1